MTRALTLADVIAQLHQDSNQSIDLSNAEVINEYIPDYETCLITQTNYKISQAKLLTPYDVNIINDGGPVGYWRLNESSNILTAAMQSFEVASVAASGWAVGNACTLAISTTQAKDGTKSLQVTATAANSAPFSGGVTNQFCSPNTAYAGTYWIFSTVAARTFTMQVNFYTSAGVFVSSQAVGSFTPTVNTWTQCTFTVTSPATGGQFNLEPTCTNSANTNIWYLDVVSVQQIGYDSNSLNSINWPSSVWPKNSAGGGGTAGSILMGQNGPIAYPDGTRPPGAIQFGAVGDVLSVANATALQITGDLSVEFWVNANSGLSGSGANLYSIFSKNGDSSEYSVYLDGAGAVFYKDSSGTSLTVAASSSIPNTNTWHHVVVTRQYTTRTIACYVDSVLKTTNTYTNSPVTTTNAVTIGASASHNTLVAGQLAEVAVYGRVLSAAQVLNHYQWAGFGSPPSGQVATGTGYGNSFQYAYPSANAPASYGQYGYFQYPAGSPPASTTYDSGSGVWGTFVWS